MLAQESKQLHRAASDILRLSPYFLDEITTTMPLSLFIQLTILLTIRRGEKRLNSFLAQLCHQGKQTRTEPRNKIYVCQTFRAKALIVRKLAPPEVCADIAKARDSHIHLVRPRLRLSSRHWHCSRQDSSQERNVLLHQSSS